jgi:hypothetical protein
LPESGRFLTFSEIPGWQKTPVSSQKKAHIDFSDEEEKPVLIVKESWRP